MWSLLFGAIMSQKRKNIRKKRRKHAAQPCVQAKKKAKKHRPH